MRDTLSPHRASHHILIQVQIDVGTILALIKELALYEKEPHAVEATEQSLLQTLSFALPSHPAASQLSSSKTLEAHTAWSHGYARTLLLEVEEEGKVEVAGMALYFFNYSTWRGRQGIYLEDLFVREKFRRRGYGVRLFKELAGIVKRMEGGRLDWSVLKWNEPSIKF